MIRRKRITVLGVSVLAALGLMSVSAAGAQAASWTIDGKTMSELKLNSAGVAWSGGPISLSNGVDFQIACASQSGTGQLLSAGTGTAAVKLSECTLSGVEETCQVKGGAIQAKAAMTLSTGGTYVVFKPESGAYAAVTIERVDPWVECPYLTPGFKAQTFTLSGDFAGEVGSDAVTLPIAFSQEIDYATRHSGLVQKGLGLNLSGASLLYPDGSSGLTLTGTNAGKVLGAI